MMKANKKMLKGNKMVCPEQLPQTGGSIMQHYLRVHHQIMAWRGIELPPENYGWVLRDNKLRAKITNDPPAPQSLLESIFCNCKTDCLTKRCTCKRFSLHCTDLCGSCNGAKCSNTAKDY